LAAGKISQSGSKTKRHRSPGRPWNCQAAPLVRRSSV